jgi:hypothetical protein
MGTRLFMKMAYEEVGIALRNLGRDPEATYS